MTKQSSGAGRATGLGPATDSPVRLDGERQDPRSLLPGLDERASGDVGPVRVLLVEDDLRLAQIVARVLGHEGFDVELAADGRTGLAQARTGSHDVLILDRLLPALDGLSLLRELRADRISTPILMLTARGDWPDRIEGLDAGADDYLGKPFAFEELLARLRALMRRASHQGASEQLVVGDLVVDLTARSVERAGRPIDLTEREFAMFQALVRGRGRVLGRDALLAQVWGDDADQMDGIVDLYIHYLRRKLDASHRGGRHSLIRTVRGVGYLLRGE